VTERGCGREKEWQREREDKRWQRVVRTILVSKLVSYKSSERLDPEG
jgi:hypothetical protein